MSSPSTSFVLIPSNDGSTEPPAADSNPFPPAPTADFNPPPPAPTSPAPLSDSDPGPPARTPYSRYIVRLTDVSFYSSIVTIFFLVPAYILHTIRIYSTSYSVQNDIVSLFIYNLGSLLLAFLNRRALRRNGTTPLAFNFALDLLFCIVIGSSLLAGIVDLKSEWRYPCWPRYGYRPSPPGCRAFEISTLVVVVFALVAVGIVWISHVVMFALRFNEVWRLKLWRRPFPWFANLPAGQISFAFEFSIKVVKAERDEEREGQRSDVAGHSQGSGVEERTGNETEILVEV